MLAQLTAPSAKVQISGISLKKRNPNKLAHISFGKLAAWLGDYNRRNEFYGA